MRLLKLILKASGKRGVPQGGVISPLLANIYLNEVDKMLEKAKEVTRQGTVYPYRVCPLCGRYGDPGGWLLAMGLVGKRGSPASS